MLSSSAAELVEGKAAECEERRVPMAFVPKGQKRQYSLTIRSTNSSREIRHSLLVPTGLDVHIFFQPQSLSLTMTYSCSVFK